jgi:hypothetical protein
MKKTNVLLMMLVSLFMVVALSSCSKDDEKNKLDKIKAGTLSGSTWSRTDVHTSDVGNYDYTYKLTFISDKEARVVQTGWWQAIDAATWKMGAKQNVNTTTDYTYIYSPELQDGVATKKSSSSSKVIFSIASTFSELTWGSSTYKLQ